MVLYRRTTSCSVHNHFRTPKGGRWWQYRWDVRDRRRSHTGRIVSITVWPSTGIFENNPWSL